MIKIYIAPVRVDDETSMQTRISLSSLIQNGGRKLICDFSNTQFLSASGVEAFANSGKMLMHLGGELGICWARPNLQTMFEEANLAKYVKFYNLEESINIYVIRELVEHFDSYEDVKDIITRREGDITIIEIFLLFASDSTMGEVQQTITLLKEKIEKQIQKSRVIIIANGI